MTQYDALGSSYDVMETLPFKALELHNVLLAIQPLIKPNAAVLEYACGTGYYCSRLLSWGFSSVTSMDISSPMLSAASVRLSSHIPSGRIRLVLADGRKPQSFSPDDSLNYFNVAFGAWFLNYARSKTELTAMFASIALNLKSGGVFVGVVPHPTENISQRASVYSKPPLNRLWPRKQYTKELKSGEGWDLRVFLNDDGVDFLTWHLKKEIYEQAARDGGMNGKLEWRRELFPGEEWKETYGLTGQDEWRVREENPHLGILVVWKD
ncbi:hypothetical protein CBS63078_11145 [Aspergillus niger]|nr:hypothetical protein CBS13152_11076 [Aspergillus niger]GLA78714.1 hypothetical protein AtubIFM55763_011728 [Aspergillus tubingensis]KAI2871223.1 hypothetical protein CBS11852_11007 [Aspergillus niger]KAI2885623.1 hypothetical protein CBS63078_11145 [Aspergillus niger]KAI3015199.1 hypothetical protein CBS147347_11263 [Aspergillus niger]